MLPDTDNLAVCDEHGIMNHASDDHHGRCPLCALDGEYDVRREDEISGGEGVPQGRLSQQEIRQRIESETMQELLPIVEEYLEDRSEDGEADLWVTVAPVADGQLPMGYSKAQERWANVVGYIYGNRVKYISSSPAAEETIETLRENGYGDDA